MTSTQVQAPAPTATVERRRFVYALQRTLVPNLQASGTKTVILGLWSTRAQAEVQRALQRDLTTSPDCQRAMLVLGFQAMVHNIVEIEVQS